MDNNRYKRIEELKCMVSEIPINEIVQLRIEEHGYFGASKYLCPFHDDHTPNNFKVFKKNNSWWCFCCNFGGDGVKFIMMYDNISWKEALIKIAVEKKLIDSVEANNLLSNSGQYISTSTTGSKFISNKQDDISSKITEVSSEDLIDRVYSIFCKGYTLMGKNKLTDEHHKEISEMRNLTNEEIVNDGYFTFPNEDFLDTFIEELKKNGMQPDDLKGVPGFYYSVQKQRWAFTLLRGTSGVGIPIRGIDGKIKGIQIRLDKVSEGKKRYQWFSSLFAGGDGSTGAKSIYGTGPGVPVAVVRPKELKNGTIFVTEGFFKARAIAKRWQTIGLSVQGVNNWKEIPTIIEILQKEHSQHKNLCIAFDGDMGRKETVLKPALQMGFAIAGIKIEDEQLEKEFNLFLKSGNRPISSKASNYKEMAKKIEDLLDIQKQIININYLVWWESDGKGIDDLINYDNLLGGGILSTIKRITLKDFWHYAFEMMCELDDERETICLANGTDFRKTSVSDEFKTKSFENHFLR